MRNVEWWEYNAYEISQTKIASWISFCSLLH